MVEISPKAASIALCAFSGAKPCTRTLTNVPSSGLARSMRCKDERIGGEKTAHAVRDVFGGECGAGDILDIVCQVERGSVPLAGELRAPFGIAHLAAIGFAIFEDFVTASAGSCT